MAIPYHTAKFKPTNTVAIVILGSTTKFNSCHIHTLYFQLYSICMVIPYQTTKFKSLNNFAMAFRAQPPNLTPTNKLMKYLAM